MADNNNLVVGKTCAFIRWLGEPPVKGKVLDKIRIVNVCRDIPIGVDVYLIEDEEQRLYEINPSNVVKVF